MPPRFALLGAASAALLLGGCVERLISVRSDPPGADVLLDDEKVGVTPCEVRFTWYGQRNLVVERVGFRSVRETLSLNPPWWQIFPLDFVTDVLVPFRLTDRLEVSYVLQPAPASEREADEVRRRAEELRRRLDEPVPK